MYLKRLAVATALFLGLTLVVWGTLNVLIGQAYAQGGGAGISKKQAGIERGRPRPAFSSSSGPHIASVGNGDFEAGPDGSWTEYSAQGWPLIVHATELVSGVTPHGGDWAVWLGGDNDEVAYISQTVTIPTDQPVLTFWEWIASAETGCTYDLGSVRINDTEVSSIPLCSSANTGGWVESTLDLDTYAGQTVQLQFLVTTNSITNSNLFIDDVTLEGQSPDYSVYLPIVLNNACGYDYFDDFSDPNSGWYPGVDGDVTRAYIGGEYRILFDNFNLDWYVTPDLVIPSSNYRVEADMREDSNFPSGTYGLIFGVHWGSSNGADQAYQVLISPRYRQYFINKKVGGSWPILRNWTYSEAIHSDARATNHLRVDRVGTAIRVYINGTAMPALTDASYTGSGRDAGVAAYSYDSYPVDMLFDNFHASTCPQ